MGSSAAGDVHGPHGAGLDTEGDDRSGGTSWPTSDFQDEFFTAVVDTTLTASDRIEKLQVFFMGHPSWNDVDRALAAALSPWTLSEDRVVLTDNMRENVRVSAAAVELVLVEAWELGIFEEALTHVFGALSPFVTTTRVQGVEGVLYLLGTISVAVSTTFDTRDGLAASCSHWMRQQHHEETACDERKCFAVLHSRFAFLGVLFGIRHGVYEIVELSKREGFWTWADDVLLAAACQGATRTVLALTQVAPLGLDVCSVCQCLVLNGLPPSSACTIAAGLRLLTIVMRGAAQKARRDAEDEEPDSVYKVRKAAVRVQLLATRLRAGGGHDQHALPHAYAPLVNTALQAWLSIFEGTAVWRPFHGWAVALSQDVLKSYSGAESGMQVEESEDNERSRRFACDNAARLLELLVDE